ncbi:hypothetical protein ACX0HA_08295 [Flavobacterium hauense]
MKNLFITALTLLFLTACHNDDDAAKTSGLLPKSGSDIFEDGETILADFEFDGKKLKRITWNDDSYETYEYENGKIKYANQYIEGDLVIKKTFEYDGDKLLRVTADDLDVLEREVVKYTYNNNNTVSIEEYGQDLEEEGEIPELYATGVITLTNGNITKFVRTYAANNATETYTYTFDDKKGPYTNVEGFDIMKLSECEGGVNNYTGFTVASEDTNFTTTYTNTYNTEGYITKAVGNTSGSITTSTYDYFQN